jgi:hypothetical protein
MQDSRQGHKQCFCALLSMGHIKGPNLIAKQNNVGEPCLNYLSQDRYKIVCYIVAQGISGKAEGGGIAELVARPPTECS